MNIKSTLRVSLGGNIRNTEIHHRMKFNSKNLIVAYKIFNVVANWNCKENSTLTKICHSTTIHSTEDLHSNQALRLLTDTSRILNFHGTPTFNVHLYKADFTNLTRQRSLKTWSKVRVLTCIRNEVSLLLICK